MDMIQRMK